jgi:limonene-1,2-epoxide hydrolase
MGAQSIVGDFIAAWNRNDLETAFGMMADDIIWDNIPMGPVQGVEGCKALMGQFPPIEGIEFVTHHIVANGNIVMTERTDKFLIGGTWRAIRLMGIFELNDAGKIKHWRDYFDMVEFQREFA